MASIYQCNNEFFSPREKVKLLLILVNDLRGQHFHDGFTFKELIALLQDHHNIKINVCYTTLSLTEANDVLLNNRKQIRSAQGELVVRFVKCTNGTLEIAMDIVNCCCTNCKTSSSY